MERDRYDSLQILRGLAAMAVVAFHLRGVEIKYLPGPALLDGIARYADAGVDLFFVLSGFVMTTITAGGHRGPAAAGAFLARRAWRVIPPYWIFTTLVVALMAVAPSMVNSSYSGQSVLASYLLLPHEQLPVLTVGWTLVHEAYFYLVFALIIALVPARRLTGALLAWLATISVVHIMLPPATTPAQMLVVNPLTYEFIAGALLGIHWRSIPGWCGPPLVVLGVGVAMASAWALPEQGPSVLPVWTRVGLFGSAAAALVAGTIVLESRYRPAFPGMLIRLGDWSYALYLSHVFVISAVGRAWSALLSSTTWLSHAGFVLVASVVCCATAALVHRTVEQPLLALPGRISTWRRAASN